MRTADKKFRGSQCSNCLFFAWTNQKRRADLAASEKMVRDSGFEPLTPSVSGKCSTTELTAQAPKEGRYSRKSVRLGKCRFLVDGGASCLKLKDTEGRPEAE